MCLKEVGVSSELFLGVLVLDVMGFLGPYALIEASLRCSEEKLCSEMCFAK